MNKDKYTYTREVDAHDTDAYDRLRPSACLRYMQTAANLQLHTHGPTSEQLRAEGKAFVLTRVSLDFVLPLHAYETVTAETFALESRGFIFGRCFRLMRGEETAVSAESVWALIDIETHKPQNVSCFHAGFDTHEPPAIRLPLRFHMPSDGCFECVGDYRVTYDRVDVNRHMNNTCYPDMLAEFLPMENKRVRRMILNFQKEAPERQTLSVYRAKIDDTYYFKTLRGDGTVNIEAEITLTET